MSTFTVTHSTATDRFHYLTLANDKSGTEYSVAVKNDDLTTAWSIEQHRMTKYGIHFFWVDKRKSRALFRSLEATAAAHLAA